MAGNLEKTVVRSPRRYAVTALGLAFVLLGATMPFGAPGWGALAVSAATLAGGALLLAASLRSGVEIDARVVRHRPMSFGEDRVPRSEIVAVDLVAHCSWPPTRTLGLVQRDGGLVVLDSLSWCALPGRPEPRRSQRVREALGYPAE